MISAKGFTIAEILLSVVKNMANFEVLLNTNSFIGRIRAAINPKRDITEGGPSRVLMINDLALLISGIY